MLISNVLRFIFTCPLSLALPITFHCARHSFAIMMLDAGVDLYTLSKLMGHKSIESTQIYAKILDKHKQAAITRIPKIF